MSENHTPWSEIITAISGFLTVLSNYLGTQPLTTLFAVLLGATATYTIQKRLQRESEKRSKNVEYVEQYYGPLLLEIQDIQDKILDNVSGFYEFRNFDGFRTRPQFYSMGRKFREDFVKFNDEIRNFADQIIYQRNKIINLICERGKPFLEIPSGAENIAFLNDSSYPPIYLRYIRESDRVAGPLHDCFLQEKSPIELIKEKVTKFQEKFLVVEFDLEVDRGKQGHDREHSEKSYLERKKVLERIIFDVKEELNKDQSYVEFRKELEKLRNNAESISTRLSNYINKYVSTVDI